MTPAQVLPHLLKLNLTMLKEAPKNPNTASPYYHPNSGCTYHSESPGHDTDNYWALKNKIQDLIDDRVLEFTQYDQLELFYHPLRASIWK